MASDVQERSSSKLMDTILIVIAATSASTALVLGLLWIAQRTVRLFPKWANSPPANVRALWGAAGLFTITIWFMSLDLLLAADGWSFIFCQSLLLLVLLPPILLHCLKLGLAPHPNLTAMAKIEWPGLKVPDITLDPTTKTKMLNTLKGGNRIEAIKLCKEASGITLWQARLYVVDIERCLGPAANVG